MSHFCEFRESDSARLLSVRSFPLRLTLRFVRHLALQACGSDEQVARLTPPQDCFGCIAFANGEARLSEAAGELFWNADEDGLHLCFGHHEQSLRVVARALPRDPVIDVGLSELMCGFGDESRCEGGASMDSQLANDIAEALSAVRDEEEVSFRRSATQSVGKCAVTEAGNQAFFARKLKKLAEIEEGFCPICYSSCAADPARLPACAHSFCFPCIQEWARVTNLCPLCKAEFLEIQRGGETVPVEPKKAQFVYEETSEDRIVRNADDYCYACERSDNFNFMLICDKCLKKCCHMACLDPPMEFLPDCDWFCDYCVEEHGLTPAAPIANVFRRARAARQRSQRPKRVRSRSQRRVYRPMLPDNDWLTQDAPVVRLNHQRNVTTRMQTARYRKMLEEEGSHLDRGINSFFASIEQEQRRGQRHMNTRQQRHPNSRNRQTGLRERNFNSVFAGFVDEMADF